MSYFRDKTVWVTGASSGIGRALVQCLAREGARVILSARGATELHCSRELSGLPEQRSFVLPFDLTGDTNFAEQARLAWDRFGGVDILINSAGISQRSLAHETEMSVNRRFMEVNFFGPVSVVKAILPRMLERRSGHIALVSSLAGFFGTPMRSAYAASKHALHGYFESLRAEVCSYGIHVTLLCPGYVATEISLKSLVGDGTAYGRIDESIAHGMPAAKCAGIILDGVRRKKNEVFIGGWETYAVYLKRFFPNTFARLISKTRTV